MANISPVGKIIMQKIIDFEKQFEEEDGLGL